MPGRRPVTAAAGRRCTGRDGVPPALRSPPRGGPDGADAGLTVGRTAGRASAGRSGAAEPTGAGRLRPGPPAVGRPGAGARGRDDPASGAAVGRAGPPGPAARACGAPVGPAPGDRRAAAGRRSAGAPRPRGSEASRQSRSRSRQCRSMRETCICDTPTMSAICRWVSSSWKRRCRTRRSRSGSRRTRDARGHGVDDASERGVVGTDQAAERDVRAGPAGASRERARHSRGPRGARPARVLGSRRVGPAICRAVGERPPCRCSSSSAARKTWPLASCRARGSRTAPVRSRRCRRSSPVTLGSAYARKA